MNMMRTTFSIVLAACTFAMSNSPAIAQSPVNSNIAASVPNLTVIGRAELSKAADELRLKVGVVTQHAEAAEALRQNARRMNDMIKAVERAGLEEDEYETGHFQIQPVYSSRPQRSHEEWRQEIIAYRVTNIIHVKTPQIDLAGKIIDHANEAGANSIDSIQFTLSDARKHRAEAIREATKNAISDARVLAEAAGLRLVRIVSMTLDEQPQPYPVRHEMMRAVASDAAESTPIRPGDVTVRAAVTIVYEVAPHE